jgi:hypothetical protein
MESWHRTPAIATTHVREASLHSELGWSIAFDSPAAFVPGLKPQGKLEARIRTSSTKVRHPSNDYEHLGDDIRTSCAWILREAKIDERARHGISFWFVSMGICMMVFVMFFRWRSKAWFNQSCAFFSSIKYSTSFVSSLVTVFFLLLRWFQCSYAMVEIVDVPVGLPLEICT